MASRSNKKKVIITGSRGFTGQYLIRALQERNYEVYGLVQSPVLTVNEYQADITNLSQLKKCFSEIQPNYIIHLAAISSVTHGRVEDFYQVNLFGTLNLLQAIKDTALDIRKIIIASSANVYGNTNKAYIDETVCPLPVNHYANSKLAMENMVRTWFDEQPIIIARPFNYTGPHQSDELLIPKIVRHYIKRKAVVELGNLNVIRDFSDIRFVVDSYIVLLESPLCSEIFNICSNKGYSITDIIEMMNEIAGYKIQIKINSELVRKNEVYKLIGVNQKLLSVSPQLKIYPLQETLRNMYFLKD